MDGCEGEGGREKKGKEGGISGRVVRKIVAGFAWVIIGRGLWVLWLVLGVSMLLSKWG